jgi:hypothetical protein
MLAYKSLPAHRTLDPLKVDAPHLSRMNQTSTFRAHRIERFVLQFSSAQ